MKIAGTFDVECSDWSTFAMGAIYDGSASKVFYDIDAMLDELRRRGGVWYGHAAGVYDSLLFLERARVRGIKCQIDRAQHRVSRVVMGSLTLRDSYTIWPVPLDDICGALGRPVPALPWPCECGRDCGGFCQIGSRAAEGDPDLEAYCVADCRALYDGLTLLDGFAIEHTLSLRGTLGQTAWVSAQAELGVPDSHVPFKIWDHLRRADKGGRATIIKPLAKGPGTHYDICNCYPAQLSKTSLPVGRAKQLGGKHALRALARERPGVYTLTVRIPEDSFFPPLPWHVRGQLCFPTGEFTGSWCLPEIGAALDRGMEIVAADSAIVFESTAPLFAPLVDRWYEIRRTVGRKTPLGQWIGRLAKALTGKFAERPERSRVTMHPEEIKVCTRSGMCRHGCTGACGAYEQLDLMGEIWAIPYQKLGPSAYPQWSSYLRAHARLQLLEQMEVFGRELAFSNVDSLWVTGRKLPSPTGSQLGQWELQNHWSDLEVRSQGTYAFRDTVTGAMEIRGVPGLTEADWKRGSGLIERGVTTFGRAVGSTKGLFSKRSRRWSLPNQEREVYGDRKLASGGITFPMSAQEIRDRVHQRERIARLREVKPRTSKPAVTKPVRSVGKRR